MSGQKPTLVFPGGALLVVSRLRKVNDRYLVNGVFKMVGSTDMPVEDHDITHLDYTIATCSGGK